MDTTGNTKTKDISQFLHLYPRCDCTYDTGREKDLIGVVTPKIIEWGMYGDNFSTVRNVRLYLRPLSDMTEEEEAEYLQIVFSHEHSATMRNLSKDAEGVKYLLSKGFDLFGLIEEGLAIGKPLK